MSLSSHRAVEVLRAAGEPTRLRVLALLRGGELSVMELAGVLGQSQPRVSRHLKLLADAGLVERFPDGSWVFYRLRMQGADGGLLRTVLEALNPDDPALAADRARMADVRATREQAAADYFARNAARWEEIRSLYVPEEAVEAAIVEAAGADQFEQMVDLGAGTGRMLRLFADQARRALGLDLSQQMLNIARVEADRAGLSTCDLRHGDIFDTRLPDGFADLVVVHQVLHYLADPAAAVAEAARLVAPGGRLLIVDFAPHQLEFLRTEHQHRRLGFSPAEIDGWLAAGGLSRLSAVTLPPEREGLTVTVTAAERAAVAIRRAA